MKAFAKILVLLCFAPWSVAFAVDDDCERRFGRVDAFFDRHEEVASRTGQSRHVDPEVLRFKNNEDERPGRHVPAARLLPTDRDHYVHMQSKADLARELPLNHRDLITSLRRGDILEMSDGTKHTLARFYSWGGTTHLFALAETPGWLLRVPRAAVVLATHLDYANREEKTAFYYEAYRDTLGRARALGIPILDAKIEDGLIFVERLEPFESAIKFARTYAEERGRGAISAETSRRREKLWSSLRRLAGKPGVNDVFLDGIAWSPRVDDWVLADFAEVRFETVAPDEASAAYGELFADAKARFGFTASDLPKVAAERSIAPRFTRTLAVPRPLKGIVVPIVTPLLPDHRLDKAGLKNVVDRAVGAGVKGVMVLGTTGEGQALDPLAKIDLIEETCRLVGLRASVLVNLVGDDPKALVALAHQARASGAGAVVLSLPEGTAPENALDLVETIARSTTLPVFLYNAPTSVPYPLEIVGRAAEIPGVVGLKDSGRDLQFFRDVRGAVADTPEFSILVGSERLLVEALKEGAHGGVSGSANVAPELLVRTYDRVVTGEPVEIERAALAMRAWKERLDRSVGVEGSFIAVLKSLLKTSGAIASDTRASDPRPKSSGRR